MPDFSSKRRFDRKRSVHRARRVPVILSPISASDIQLDRRSPLTVLNEFAKGFRNGVSALQRMIYNKTKSDEQKIVRFDTRSNLNQDPVRSYGHSAMSVVAQNDHVSRHRFSSTKPGLKSSLDPLTAQVNERVPVELSALKKQSTAALPNSFFTPQRASKFVPHLVSRQRVNTPVQHTPTALGLPVPTWHKFKAATLHPLMQHTVQHTSARTKPHVSGEHKHVTDVEPQVFADKLNSPAIVSHSHRALEHPVRRQFGISTIKTDGTFAFGKQSLVTSADREAARSVREPYVGDFHQLPAAARVAQVLQADELIRNGLGKEQTGIRALAQAAREGRKRFVADVHPSYLQKAFSEAFGGAARIEQVLNTPVVHALAERYRFAVESIQRHVERAQIVRGLGHIAAPRSFSTRSAHATASGRGRVTGDNQSYSPPRLISSSASSSNYTSSVPEKIRGHELRAQLTNNDFAHLPLAGEHAVNDAKSASRKQQTYTLRDNKAIESKLSDRRISLAPSDSRRALSAPTLPSQISRISAAPSSQGIESAKPSNNRFTGELRILDATGKNLGRAELDMKGR